MRNTNVFLNCVKLKGYLASAFKVVPTNLCVIPYPRTKIFLFLLSTYIGGLVSAQNIITYLP